VLRAAVAEVEDYTRIMVISRTEAALAGSAVADLIHLIAELAENATIFSPPNTPLRILGDTVGKGFAVEIEDRGLGISDEPLADINRDLRIRRNSTCPGVTGSAFS
jgi:K+-sensing histidine kinase KdpD